MKVSEFSSSKYLGSPLSVLREIDGALRCHPEPNTPFPDPELYESSSLGPKPPRVLATARGTETEAVPVTALNANFSPMPRIAPPPVGNSSRGGAEFDFPDVSPIRQGSIGHHGM